MTCADRATETPGLGAVADQLLAPVTVVAPDSTLLYVNAAAAHSIGQEPAWLLGRRMLELIHPDDQRRISRELRAVASGRPSAGFTRYRLSGNPALGWRTFESIADNLLDDPGIAGILVSSRDVTEHLQREEQLRTAAYHDSLTGLPNRGRIAELLDELTTEPGPLAVAFVGIDRFKLINDSLGHSAGDAVLQAVAARTQSTLPPGTILGRFAGDLLVLLIGGAAAAQARTLLWRVVERVAEPLFIAGHELRVSVSAGLAVRDATSTGESLLRDAGLALNRGKSEGGGRVASFAAEMAEAALGRLQLEADLRRGIARDEFAVALQPIVRLSDATPVRAEALIRWHRGGRICSPDEFIPVAEETGLIVPLGGWVIDRAAALAHRAPGGQVMVNLSARQLSSPGLPERIARALAAHHLPAPQMGFEITENLLVEHFDYAVTVLTRIRELGCPVGLDDFGTGYSSLSYLRRLPIDFLKIDLSLSAGVDSDPQGRAIVGAIITMAEALGIDAVAEGVETQAQADALAELGCPFAQGHLFGRPTELS